MARSVASRPGEPGEQARKNLARRAQVLGHGIEPAIAPGMAAGQPPARKRRATRSTMPAQRIEGIGRAGGFEAASAAEPWLQQPTVGLHQTHQDLARPQHRVREQDHAGWMDGGRLWAVRQHGRDAVGAATHRAPCALPRRTILSEPRRTRSVRKRASGAPATGRVVGCPRVARRPAGSDASIDCASPPGERAAWAPWRRPTPDRECYPQSRSGSVASLWISRPGRELKHAAEAWPARSTDGEARSERSATRLAQT